MVLAVFTNVGGNRTPTHLRVSIQANGMWELTNVPIFCGKCFSSSRMDCVHVMSASTYAGAERCVGFLLRGVR